MSRNILDEAHLYSAIRQKIQDNHSDIVGEVQAAIAANDVVVVGMRQNPWPKKARQALDATGIPYKYLEYGSYLGDWRRRPCALTLDARKPTTSLRPGAI